MKFATAKGNDAVGKQETSKYSNSSAKHKEITVGLLDMISESMLPLNFADSTGFKKFMQLVDPRYDIPSCRSLTRLLTGTLQTMKTSIADHITECTHE